MKMKLVGSWKALCCVLAALVAHSALPEVQKEREGEGNSYSFWTAYLKRDAK